MICFNTCHILITFYTFFKELPVFDCNTFANLSHFRSLNPSPCTFNSTANIIMGHNHSSQDAILLNEAMDEDNREDNVQDTSHLSEAMDEDKDDIYLADVDSQGSTAQMDFDAPPDENNDPMAFSVDSVDSIVDLNGDGFFLGNAAKTVFYDSSGFLISTSAHRRSRQPPPRKTAEEHSLSNILPGRSSSNQLSSPFSDLPNDGYNLSSVLSNSLSILLDQADNLANRLSAGLNNDSPDLHTNRESSQPIDQLGEQLNDLSINHPNENEPGNDGHKSPSCITSNSDFNDFDMEVIRCFKPFHIQGIPSDQLIVYNTRKQFSHLRKLKPHNFPHLSAGDTWVDEGTIVISIAAHDRAEAQMPVVWAVDFGHDSRFNMWRPVRSMLPQNKKSAYIDAIQNALGFVHTKIFLVDPDIRTVIIRNSSPWLTRVMTGGLELYNYGCNFPWLEGRELLYLQDLRRLVGLMQSMTDHGTNPLKFRFWCVEPEANREAIELAQRVYTGSRSRQN